MMNGPNPRTGDKEEEASSSRTNDDAAVIENDFPVAMLYIYLLGWVPTYAMQAYHWTLEIGDCLKEPQRFRTLF